MSLVRLKKGKKRFEIACYKNKVLEYRSGLEDNLDEVLQIPNVFLNVSKGQTAPREDLDKAFGKGKSVDDIVLEILQKGEQQVGEKERAAQLERVHAEVVDIVAGKLVDPATKRVYTTGLIGKALDQLSAASAHQRQEDAEAHRHAKRDGERRKAAGMGDGKHGDGETDGEEPATSSPSKGDKPDKDEVREALDGLDLKRDSKPLWTGVTNAKSAKSQALDAMKALIAWQPIPVARARMRLRVSCHVSILKQAVKVPASTSGAADVPSKEAKSGKGGKGGKKGAAVAAAASHAADADENSEDKHKGGGTVKERILNYFEEIESQGEVGGEWEILGFVEPGAFKPLNDFLGGETRGKGRLEVLDMAVRHED